MKKIDMKINYLKLADLAQIMNEIRLQSDRVTVFYANHE